MSCVPWSACWNLTATIVDERAGNVATRVVGQVFFTSADQFIAVFAFKEALE